MGITAIQEVEAPPPSAAEAEPALAAYEAFAPFYDDFTADYAHDACLARVERLVRALGLTGSTALDVACGTGRSTEPLARRGWRVTACDLSPAMVERARARLALPPDRVFVADMRSLPAIGPFDLVTCLDDAVNYLLTDEDLLAAFSSMAGVLRPGGMVAFDCNSLLTYRTAFASSFVRPRGDALFHWRGQGDPAPSAGTMASAAVEVFCREPSGGWRRADVGRHLQRHHPRATIERALSGAGLRLAAVRGQHTGARLVDHPDEDACPKIFYVAEKLEG